VADSTGSSQPLTAATGHSDSIRTICANWGYVRPEVEGRSTAPSRRESGLRITDPCPRHVPELPSIANDRHHQLPANIKLAPVLGSRATHGDTLVMRRSLNDDEYRSAEVPTVVATPDGLPARRARDLRSRHVAHCFGIAAEEMNFCSEVSSLARGGGIEIFFSLIISFIIADDL
jgi:hypothetical protein